MVDWLLRPEVLVKVPALPLPGVSLLDRYIFMELALPFLFGVAAFTS